MVRAAWGIAAAICGMVLVCQLGEMALQACCPAGRHGQPVVNADQSVIMIWDAAQQTQHFIRKASFASKDDDVGFVIPTPTLPELEESGNDAFGLLAQLTAPEVRRVSQPRGGCACSSPPLTARVDANNKVEVLLEKRVAGFDARVLEADSATALVEWLNEHGFAMTPEVEAWAQPYIAQQWKFTALKVAREPGSLENHLQSPALRLSFKTDRPLFPYREPDPKTAAETLAARHRLLRIYFLADARFRGHLGDDGSWSGDAVWSDRISNDRRAELLAKLGLPLSTGPSEFWLTEFEDHWKYESAPSDVHFARDPVQDPRKRPPTIEYVQRGSNSNLAWIPAALAFAACLAARNRRSPKLVSAAPS
ncbi:MAG: DUF2330 domain-containing protein [Planctomycetes bacterium]|nr:DUF2330 domain-containing protein [Planctomycetota bacterium]